MGRMWCWLLLVVTLPALAVDHPPVRPGRSVSLPADTGAHPGYRTEWWYVTGWLDDGRGATGFPDHLLQGAHGYRRAVAGAIQSCAADPRPCRGRRCCAGTPAACGAQRPRLRPAGGCGHRADHAWVGDWRLEERDGVFIAEVSAREFSYSRRWNLASRRCSTAAQGSARRPRPASRELLLQPPSARREWRGDGGRQTACRHRARLARPGVVQRVDARRCPQVGLGGPEPG